jgi:hypothetical protein
VAQFKGAVEARGDRFWLNMNVVGNRGALQPDYYARETVAIYQHMEARYGFLPDSWEVALEPGMFRWGSADKVATAMLATAQILENNGFRTPYFVGPSSECGIQVAIDWFNQMARVPGALPLIKEFSYHRYCAPSDADLAHGAEIGRVNGINTSQLEHIGATYEELHADLKLANVSAWQQYILFQPATEDKGAQYYIIDNARLDAPAIRIASRTKFLRQYFRFIRPGAVRIGATSDDERVDPLAFQNASGSQVLVAKVNGGATFSVRGLPEGIYGTAYTTERDYDVNARDVAISSGEDLTVSIPATGVITIYGKPSEN